MKKISSIAFALLICTNVFSQQPEEYIGSWEGTLNVGTELKLVFHINKDERGNFKATADSPDQGAYGLPCDTVIFSSGNVIIELRDIQASYKGIKKSDSLITGTFTQGAEFPLDLKKMIAKPAADYLGNTRNISQEVEIKANDVTLSGTLVNPSADKKPKVVLIIAGSGPTDRDGNTTGSPAKNNSLLQLADSLSQAGIATLRYDKRGIGKSLIIGGFNEELITIEDMVNDARSMYEWLKKENFNEIFIAGHSEGSLIGLLLSQQVKPAGFISIAGAGRKASEILEEQLSIQLDAGQMQFFKSAVDSIQQGHVIKNVPEAFQSLLRPSVQPYLRSWFVHDPFKLVGKLKCPVLIVQGKKDIQVGETDARKLKEGLPAAKLTLIDDMNHVLKIVESDDRMENIKAYSDPSLPLSNELVRALVAFIKTPKK